MLKRKKRHCDMCGKSNIYILFETKSCQAYCKPLKLITALVGFTRGFICIIKPHFRLQRSMLTDSGN
jgi:hypothetical protein